MLDKELALQATTQTIRDFLEWASDQGYELALQLNSEEVPHSVRELIAEFLEIDLTQVEKEKQAVSAWGWRRQNDKD